MLVAFAPRAALAQDPGAGPNPHHEAARIIAAELAMEDANNGLTALAGEQPSGLADTMRQEMAVGATEFEFRQAARLQQRQVYDLAGYDTVASAVLPLLPSNLQPPIADSIAALHSLYILGGIDQYYLVNPHYTLPYSNAAPMSALRTYYAEAQRRYGIDASYLAAINFIESKFGRVNGPSSANALGPMQFLPGTWAEYGQGGNVMDPHDAILAAARLLVHNGAPYDMRNAIWHYNNSFDYVDSVEAFARAYRADPGWLDRMYYWDTAG
ncbi:MAG TPA: lytic transglycosylase domain-containing protein [Candidatus Dormibacteraeota bacterium]|nr:lytic transglycosylase domain-containing protein [Candidatus Dormibacteraeota bacterium]